MNTGSLPTLEQFTERSSGYDRGKFDLKSKVSEVGFGPIQEPGKQEEMLVMSARGAAMWKPTDHALTQICAKLGPSHFGKGSTRSLPMDYINNWPPGERSDILNMHIRRASGQNGGGNKTWLLRTYGENCRAVLNGDYPVVNNTDLLLSVQDAISDERMKGMELCRKSFIDADRMHLYISWHTTGADDGNGGTYALGSYVSNDEVGKGAIHIWPFVKRTSCDNSITMRPHKQEDADMNMDQFVGMSFVHRGNLVVLNTLVKAAIARSLLASAEIIEKMVLAAHEELPSIMSVIDGLAKQYHWTEPVRDNVLRGTEGRSTRAALVNGITFAAREMEDPDESSDMSAMGGAVLVAPNSLFAKAARMAMKQEVEELVLVER